ncbi:MAG TPA: hypothetical protein VGS96_22635 [Thermoanaerobaculia bacterium]|jgi:hypothetical protein|nr:hypothetical protein [Thermoanaerobaculia bacterium]
MSAALYAANPRFSDRKHHVATTAALIVLFWAFAALLVIAADREIGPLSPHVSIVAELAAIIAAGFAYMRLTARDATVDHALLVGTLWLFFAIIAEIAVTAHFGHAWFELLGAPAKPIYRCLLMFAWVAAPALFASGRS